MRILIISLLSMSLISSGTAQQASNQAGEKLYLLAATPTQNSYSKPVTLYRVSNTKRLLRVRVIEPAGADGSVRVVPSKTAIFLIHPTDVVGPTDDSASMGIQHPKTVTILQYDNPMQVDDMAINPDGAFGDWYTIMAAAPTPTSEELLLPLQSLAPVSLLQDLTGIKENSNGRYESVQPEDWNAYANLRLEGESGGPHAPHIFAEAKVSGDHVVLWHLGHTEQHPIPISSIPPELKDQNGEIILSILASSDKYLVLSLDCDNGKGVNVPCESHDLFVLDRQANKWKTVPTEGMGGVRLFGPWLTVNVTFNMARWEVFHQQFAGKMNNELAMGLLNPGILLLQNLDTGREYGLATNHENSEILSVKNDILFYRVNDAIYKAKLGEQSGTGQSTLLVKDLDVPQIHWLFWSTKTDASVGREPIHPNTK